jgi:uncharacterized membrane protein YjgN (DUF898 family)
MSTDIAQPQDMSVGYTGVRGALFAIVLKTLLLTMLTLGMYRFWMRARIRRYYWASVRPGGQSMEYLGTGAEKFIGFLIAVVFLAIYLGIFQLILTFVSLTLLSESGFNIAILAVVPLVFYARYRARRYILARTRWRGIRFGAEKAAVGYAMRAMGYSLLTIISGGILYPLQLFRLEKYATDRTWFGDLKLNQGGRWSALMKAWLAAFLPVVLIIGLMFVMMIGYFRNSGAGLESSWIFGIDLGVIGTSYLLIGIAIVYFQARSFIILTQNKTAGQAVIFRSHARPWLLVRITIVAFLAILAICAVLAYGAFLLTLAVTGVWLDFDLLQIFELIRGGNYLPAIIAFASYAIIIMIASALWHLFVTQPVLRHYCETLTVVDQHDEIENVRQRARDENVEAEGFADALDVGAAI